VKILLRKKHPSLGESGEVKSVKDGYARNFLIPKGFAVPYTAASEKEVEALKKSRKRREKRIRDAKEELKSKIEALLLEIPKKAGPGGKLFGRLTPGELSILLSKKGLKVDKKLIQIQEKINITGEHTVKIDLAEDLEASLLIKVIEKK